MRAHQSKHCHTICIHCESHDAALCVGGGIRCSLGVAPLPPTLLVPLRWGRGRKPLLGELRPRRASCRPPKIRLGQTLLFRERQWEIRCHIDHCVCVLCIGASINLRRRLIVDPGSVAVSFILGLFESTEILRIQRFVRGMAQHLTANRRGTNGRVSPSALFLLHDTIRVVGSNSFYEGRKSVGFAAASPRWLLLGAGT